MSSTDDSEVATESTALDRWPTFRLDHAIEEDGDTRCTMYPSNVSDDRQTGAWITAHGDAFLDIDEVR